MVGDKTHFSPLPTGLNGLAVLKLNHSEFKLIIASRTVVHFKSHVPNLSRAELRNILASIVLQSTSAPFVGTSQVCGDLCIAPHHSIKIASS